ncbi:type II toxin-antitoxin system HicB family antitoxin [Sinosporangium siamense]|uniref:Type II toxin-antitoxin system HicB family antitoxin n=1 Tax=Sinosporangium siamense TaxID=1367973 RepID=A0A919V7M5_9ACTN|nr:type II toxin-antitoxin system HicB family antitoxin [Sinosporangium siamense]GII92252.1 hypothetical protein Ssi02_24830 [Sinosporangium siamense]
MNGALRFTATVTPDDEGWFVAQCNEVDVTSQGRSADEALIGLREALELFFEDS